MGCSRIGTSSTNAEKPSTAKGIVFITIEDETGFAKVVVILDVFQKWKRVIVGNPALLIEGVLQSRDGVIHVKAERFAPLVGKANVVSRSHDFP